MLPEEGFLGKIKKGAKALGVGEGGGPASMVARSALHRLSHH
jgi:hypothetical protein